MVYAKISIGVLGFIVWSQMALFFVKMIKGGTPCPPKAGGVHPCFHEEITNFAICQNSLTLLSTLNSKNLNKTPVRGEDLKIFSTEPAGNLNNLNPSRRRTEGGWLMPYTGPSETTREISFKGRAVPAPLQAGPFDLFFNKYNHPATAPLRGPQPSSRPFRGWLGHLEEGPRLGPRSGSGPLQPGGELTNDSVNNWLTWFIGFVEGASCIGAYNNRLTFVITQKESNILYEIQNFLNIGSVCRTKDNIYRFSVNKQEEILKLVYIFNGNLVLKHRIKQLSLWFSILDQKGVKLPKFNDKPISLTLDDAWLSGFTDAEGCFNVGITLRKDGRSKRPATSETWPTSNLSKRVVQRFILDQNNFYNEFIHICNLFNSGFVSLRPKTSHQFRLTIQSYNALNCVVAYFLKYPLKTKKSNNFNLWRDCVNKVQNKEHLTEEGLKKIQNLKKQINFNNSKNKKIGLSLR